MIDNFHEFDEAVLNTSLNHVRVNQLKIQQLALKNNPLILIMSQDTIDEQPITDPHLLAQLKEHYTYKGQMDTLNRCNVPLIVSNRWNIVCLQ